jgi:hypothetical protein
LSLEKDLKDYPIDLDYFDEARTRVTLARKVDSLEHQINKEKNNTSWYEKHAKMLDIELDDELIKETRVDNNDTRKKKSDLNKFKQELEKQLKKMILPKNVSRNYLRQDSFNKIISMNSKKIFFIPFIFDSTILFIFFNLETEKNAIAEMKANPVKKNKKVKIKKDIKDSN